MPARDALVHVRRRVWPCGHCDVCQGAVRLIDGRVEAQKALSAVLRTSGRFLFGHLANVLAGKTTEAIERHGHDQLKTFGVGKDRTPAGWRGILRQLQSAKLIVRDEEDRDRLVVTDEGRRIFRGEAPSRSARTSKPGTQARRAQNCRARRCGRRFARGAEGSARRDRGGAEAAGLRDFPGQDADRDGERAAGHARRPLVAPWGWRGQAQEIRARVPGGHSGPGPCLSCPRSRRSGVDCRQQWSAHGSRGSN